MSHDCFFNGNFPRWKEICKCKFIITETKFLFYGMSNYVTIKVSQPNSTGKCVTENFVNLALLKLKHNDYIYIINN